jgi:uncharacterized protein (TIGR00369 family)
MHPIPCAPIPESLLCSATQIEEEGIMNIMTHRKISTALCGRPLEAGDGRARVEMKTIRDMTVDDLELVHGGFIFGLADHAAMIAVNHPNVVLGAADVKFLKPVKADETVIAEARVAEQAGKKKVVPVTVKRGDDVVFEGTFTCFVLERHVLS